MKLAEIRQKFLNYFEQKNHKIVKSSPLVPANDLSLLFTNSGMVQFKEVFLGLESRPYTRATTVQRCLRAGGKHNDLENVGYTARHHTFFEMLGNFSFGDYFKEDAIAMAWEFLTEVIKLPKEKLWVTVYEDDDEAADIWLNKIGVDPTRFSRCGEKDNYWSMGETGPCGPCTEIFYDHGPDVPGGPPGSKDADLDRYIEIWNLVFMQYNRSADGTLTKLPKQSVDTGMGIERLAAVVQGVHSNYEIDLFFNLINAAAAITNTKDLANQSLRVLADHIRACSFLIADGVIPSNEGRGYVLRRIIRRAIRHGNKLGMSESFFYKLVEPLCDEMGEAYPELIKAKTAICEVLKQEEEQFARTLEQGLKILNQSLEQTPDTIDGFLAFKLYDTYGFPIDLTLDIARESQINVDIKGFEQELSNQRTRSKQHSGFKSVSGDGISQDIAKILGSNKTSFTGYDFSGDTLSDELTVQKILDKSSCEVSSLAQGEIGYVIFEQTPFYAEGGGQVGDQGILSASNTQATVTNTIKVNKVYLHNILVNYGTIKAGDRVKAVVDLEKRRATARNHSATHLLHAALRRNLGEQVLQKGSYVGPDYLRFDFAYFKPVTKQELEIIEAEVNNEILKNTKTDVKSMDVEQAMVSGAVALFGEKYEEKVRVLNFGNGYSIELCGGTHVARTGDIGLFVITQETSVASGVRRIEALTGDTARVLLKQRDEQVKTLAKILKVTPNDLINKVNQLQQDYSLLSKEIEKLKYSSVASKERNLVDEAVVLNGIKVLICKLDNYDIKQLRNTIDNLKSELHQAVILLAVVNDTKVNLIAGVTNNITDKIDARELANFVAGNFNGKCGGRPDMAQGGCNYENGFEQVLESVKGFIEAKLM